MVLSRTADCTVLLHEQNSIFAQWIVHVVLCADLLHGFEVRVKLNTLGQVGEWQSSESGQSFVTGGRVSAVRLLDHQPRLFTVGVNNVLLRRTQCRDNQSFQNVNKIWHYGDGTVVVHL